MHHSAARRTTRRIALPLAAVLVLSTAPAAAETLVVANKSDATVSLVERKAVRTIAVDLSKLDRAEIDPEGRLFDGFGDSSVPIGIEIAPDGKTAWVAHSNADAVQVLDLETWKPSGALRAGKEPDGMALAP